MTHQIYKIIDNIYLSDLDSAYDKQLIAENQIQVVIRLSEDKNKSPYDPPIQFYNFEIEDNFMERNAMRGIATLIYHMGRSRSISAIIYYLIRKHKYTFDRAIGHIRAIKPDVHVNSGFEEMLRAQ